MSCSCHVVLQTEGVTPLYIASQNGNLECVRSLLGGGAAIDQAMVGCTSPVAQDCWGGYVRGYA